MADHGDADEVRAAGAVLWRPAGRGARVALVHRPKYDDWSFAKGKLEPGEHVLLAAVREVAEETGLQVTLGRRLPPVQYLNAGVPKRVDYWAATARAALSDFTPTDEIDAVAWLAAGTAASRLSYQRDVETLAAFRSGPQRTVPLILIRHASAGSKSQWHKSDESRPLDAGGKKDAKLLAALLSCFEAGRVISSPAERCLATIRPYARAVGSQVQIEPALLPADKGEGALDPAAAKVVAELVAADEPAVICAHRENLPALFAAACAELGAPDQADGLKPLRKGEFLVLHRAARTMASAERYHPDGRC
jgi:8-oxo-dGTP pyrophosphatase MutT (NUDIX family)/phosphohistidine phosphatase SixA